MDTPLFSLQHFLGDQLIMPMPALFMLFCMCAGCRYTSSVRASGQVAE